MQKIQPQPPPSSTQLLHLVKENIPSASQAALYQQVWHFDFKCPLVGENPKPPEEICPKLGQISHTTKGNSLLRKIAKNLTLRLTEEEYQQLISRSEEWSLKIEPTVRKLIAETDLALRATNSYTFVLEELNGIGKAINQIAYQANSRKGITESEIERANNLTQQAYALIESLL